MTTHDLHAPKERAVSLSTFRKMKFSIGTVLTLLITLICIPALNAQSGGGVSIDGDGGLWAGLVLVRGDIDEAWDLFQFVFEGLRPVAHCGQVGGDQRVLIERSALATAASEVLGGV